MIVDATEKPCQPKPSFLFIGSSKAGSSWFFEILREHPDVFVPANKATFFFTEHYAKTISWYESFFSRARPEQIVGEVCHDYLASPEALRRIRDYRPDMRLICCLRNPYARALSSWRFFGRNGMSKPTLAAQMESDVSVFEHGNYASQLGVLQSLFTKQQILIFFFEELSSNPEGLAQRLYQFIGVDSAFKPPTLYKRVNVNATPRSRPVARLMQYIHQQSWKRSQSFSTFIGQVKRIRPLRRLVRAALYKEVAFAKDWRDEMAAFPPFAIARYEREIAALEEVLGVDLSSWHAPGPGRLRSHTRQGEP